jgi:prepilin-type N-terminal cleavage/methylation domain-containing protein
MNISIRTPKQRQGVTLVELLIVISILSVMTAIMIPRLRVINKDRNIREAARIVASAFAKASTRASAEGTSGVIIERHPNFIDDNGVNYAGTRMYAMRRLPPYAGDDFGAIATVLPGGTSLTINTPFEHDPATHPLILVGDEIRLNYSSVRYRINSVSLSGLTMTIGFDLGGVRPTLEDGVYPFVIYRQPRKLNSSEIDLPDGYYIDLRVSTVLVPTPTTAPTPPDDWERGTVLDDRSTRDIAVFFNQLGAINRFTYGATNVATQNEFPAAAIPSGTLYFYVTNYDPKVLPTAAQSLSNAAAMWVTVDQVTGSVNVSPNAPPPNTLTTVFDRLLYARDFGRTRTGAAQ